MRRTPYALAATVVLALKLCVTTGCLSLGAKNTHVHDNPETEKRISALESRIGVLERVLGGHTMGAEVIPTE